MYEKRLLLDKNILYNVCEASERFRKRTRKSVSFPSPPPIPNLFAPFYHPRPARFSAWLADHEQGKKVPIIPWNTVYYPFKL